MRYDPFDNCIYCNIEYIQREVFAIPEKNFLRPASNLSVPWTSIDDSRTYVQKF